MPQTLFQKKTCCFKCLYCRHFGKKNFFCTPNYMYNKPSKFYFDYFIAL